MGDRRELIGKLSELKDWLYGKDLIDFGETAAWAAEVVEETAREASRPKRCLCKSNPVLLEHLEQDHWSLGCPQAFFRSALGDAECRRPVIMRAVGRDNAVGLWNDLIQKCESESVGSL